VSIDWEFGFDFSGVRGAVDAARPVALARAGEHIRGVAAPLTPVLTGNLVGSAFVRIVGDECHVGYPGPYARYQHYELQLKHTTGQALYLEQPMNTEAEKVTQIMADTIREAMA
jgi:hypothetical protein